MDRIWIGADPGGKKKFGLAFLDSSGRVSCTTVSSVNEAAETVARNSQAGEPLGLGIDAPMWWSSGPGGGRLVDERLRQQYGIRSGTVQSANSLRGAALIGGMFLALRIREKFPDIRITESHPKALLRALKFDPDGDGSDFAERYKISGDWRNDEDKRDAMIAAVCVREGFEGRWQTDLASQRHCFEQNPKDPQNYWLAPMHYFWHEAVP